MIKIWNFINILKPISTKSLQNSIQILKLKFYIKLCKILKSNYNKYHIFLSVFLYNYRYIVDKNFSTFFPTIYSSKFHVI